MASFMPMPLLLLLCGLFHANAFIVPVVWPLSCQCLYCYCCVASFMPMPLLFLLCGLSHANAFIVTVVWPLSCQCLYCYCCVASFMPMPLLLLLCGLFHANAFIVTVHLLLFALFQLGTLKIFIRYITKITLKFNLTPLLVLKIT
jgi:hypothetical protein